MRPLLLVSLVWLATGTGCPPRTPETEPDPTNSITVKNDEGGRWITMLTIGFSDVPSNDRGDYTFGDDLLANPVFPGESVKVMDLVDGYYYVKIETISLLGGSTHYKCIVWGALAGGLDSSSNASVFSFCT